MQLVGALISFSVNHRELASFGNENHIASPAPVTKAHNKATNIVGARSLQERKADLEMRTEFGKCRITGETLNTCT